jgi:hypothetical protein
MAKHLYVSNAPKFREMPEILFAFLIIAGLLIGAMVPAYGVPTSEDAKNLHPKPYVTRTIQNALD